LAIAKIMLKNPKIIILDEPTSALDSFSEELISKAMNNLFI
jgi:ABC-type multidrug transport system fused ATPase/permease subunit